MAFTLERLHELERQCLVGQHIAHTDQIALVRELLVPLQDRQRADAVADALLDRRTLLVFQLTQETAEIMLYTSATRPLGPQNTQHHLSDLYLEPGTVIELTAVVG